MVLLFRLLAATPAVVVAQPVINEIHFDPPDPLARTEFVELHNPGVTPLSLGGWRLGGGVEFILPAGAVLPAGGYLVVAQDPAQLKQQWGVDAQGPWGGRLKNQGDLVELRNAAGVLQDRVEFQRGFPWPTVGEPPGYSIELVNPKLDNDLAGHWRASLTEGSSGAGSTVVIPPGSDWRFFRGRSEPSSPTTAWRDPGFVDAGDWETGTLPIGYDPAIPFGTRLDDMRGNYTSVFLRRSFDVTDPGAVSSVMVAAVYDDGFKLWVNGQFLLQANIAAGELPFDGTAGASRESNEYELFTAVVPTGLLRSTGNVIAIQTHNTSLSSSSDFFVDVAMAVVRGPTGAGPTPGRKNVAFLTNAPPAIRQVEHRPRQPRGGEPVVVSARITDGDGVGLVTLAYQVVRPGAYVEMTDPAYETDWQTVTLRDDGTGGDEQAGDDVYAGTVPAPAQVHRTLVRYRIEATDLRGQRLRVPYADDPQPNFAYFVYDGVPAWTGAVKPGDPGGLGQGFTVGTQEMNRLPVLHLIARLGAVEDATWRSRYGGDAYLWTGTLVCDGVVYDHIRYRARGGVWRYAMAKNMWKFDLNRGHDFEARDDWGRPLEVKWSKLNLGASIQQGDYNHRGEQGMFESTGFRVFRLAGVPAMHSAFTQFRVIDDAEEAPAGSQYDGDFWGVYLMLEQPDGRFLEEHGLADGNLYKMEGGSGELNHMGAVGPAYRSDLDAFLGAFRNADEAWWRENLNLPDYLSYQAVVQAIHHYDICSDKNFLYHLDPDSRRWQVLPWDLDLTWAENMYDAGCGGVDRIKQRVLPNESKFPAVWREWQSRLRDFQDLFWNGDEAARLIDEQAARLRGPATGPTVLDADRAQWDYNPRMTSGEYSTSPGSKAGAGRFYRWPNYPATEVSRDFNGLVALMKRYVGFRATNAAAQARSLDSIAADSAIPPRPAIVYAGPAEFPVNSLRFRSSAYGGDSPQSALRWRVGEITRPVPPAWSATEPWKYEIEAVWESGRLGTPATEVAVPPGVLRVGSAYRARVQFEDATGRTSRWSEPVEFVAGVPDNTAALQTSLRVTELMFHAPAGATNDFIELYNAGTATLSLAGATFTQGIDFTFPAGTTLAPGAYLLVVRAAATGSFAAFRAVYGLAAGVAIAGPYAGNFNDAGETVVLRNATGGIDLLAFTYGDGRGGPLAADGAGHSLIPRADFGDAASGALDFGGNWRASAFIQGSPGRADPEPDQSVVLNEIVAHTDFISEFDSNDWLELYNRGTTALTLGAGWYLSDDPDQLKKWAIPASTRLEPSGRVVFDEVTGFNHPAGSGFSINKGGEQVYLSNFAAGTPGRVVDAVSFKGQENEWALARVPDGGTYWDQVIPRTPGTANAAILPRVVISELLYHEGGLLTNQVAAPFLEFVELHNASASAVALFNTNAVWRVAGGIDFEFPLFTSLAAGERVLLVTFDPVANPATLAGFRATLGVSASVRVFGPYDGRLDNDTDRVAIERAQAPDLPGDPITWVIVDEVDYHDGDPWPGGADGEGTSYQRRSALRPGNDPANWVASTPSPGGAVTDPVVDTDADGMPDAWENQYGLAPRDPSDAIVDPDDDGLTNLSEYLAGTHPRDPASSLRLGRLRLVGAREFAFEFTAVAGRAYVVEARDVAGNGTWLEVQDVSAAEATRVVAVSVQVVGVGSTAGGGAAYWHRVRLR